jgi:hypothetical protein
MTWPSIGRSSPRRRHLSYKREKKIKDKKNQYNIGRAKKTMYECNTTKINTPVETKKRKIMKRFLSFSQ